MSTHKRVYAEPFPNHNPTPQKWYGQISLSVRIFAGRGLKQMHGISFFVYIIQLVIMFMRSWHRIGSSIISLYPAHRLTEICGATP
jgi:hypothetical protein